MGEEWGQPDDLGDNLIETTGELSETETEEYGDDVETEGGGGGSSGGWCWYRCCPWLMGVLVVLTIAFSAFVGILVRRRNN